MSDDNPPLLPPARNDLNSPQLAPDLGLSGGDRRRELIARLEKLRSSRVLVYMDAAEDGPSPGALRYLFEHLRNLPGRPHNRIALVIHHRDSGGDLHEHLNHAMRCVTLVREFTREIEVLIPSAAFGVGTFLAIGADNLLMHPLGTLGRVAGASELAAARHFLGLLREAGIDPQQIEHRALERLLDDISPAQLGLSRYAVERLHYGVRDLVARRVHRRQDAQNQALFDALIDEACPLAHPIDRRSAKDMLALPVESMDNELETVLWSLFSCYEPALGVGARRSETAPLNAVIESTAMCHAAPRGGAPDSGWIRSVDTELH